MRTALLFSLEPEYIKSFPPHPISRTDTSTWRGYILQGFIPTNPWLFSGAVPSTDRAYQEVTLARRRTSVVVLRTATRTPIQRGWTRPTRPTRRCASTCSARPAMAPPTPRRTRPRRRVPASTHRPPLAPVCPPRRPRTPAYDPGIRRGGPVAWRGVVDLVGEAATAPRGSAEVGEEEPEEHG